MFKKISDIDVYNLSENLSNNIWNIVINWKYFDKNSIGLQLFRSADSISANIAESHGRYHYNDKKKFGYYARGSLEETKSWIRKSYKRNLISKNQFINLEKEIDIIGPKLNKLINTFKYPAIHQ